MTCAHVLNEALDRRWNAPERPETVEGVAVEFPFSGSSQRHTVSGVVEWFPPAEAPVADIAVLELRAHSKITARCCRRGEMV
jgi:hypothetical protein